jgi:ATP-binding cassette subfamily B protein
MNDMKIINHTRKILYMPRKIISIALSIAPITISANLLFIILSSLISVFTIQMTSMFFDRAMTAAKSQTHGGTIDIFLVFAVSYFLSELIFVAIDFLDFRVEKKFNNFLNEKLHQKIAHIGAIRFESAKFIEGLELAMQGIYSMDYYLFNIIGLVIKDIPYLVFLGFYLFSLRKILLIAPIIIFIPIIITQLLNVVEKRKLNEATIYLKRKLGHYENIISGASFIKETRMLGTFMHFFKLHNDLLKIINNKNWKSSVHSQMVSLSSKLINLMGYYGVLWLLFDSLMNRYITIGEFAAIFAYIQKMYYALENMIVNRIGNILSYDYNGLRYFINFLEEEEEKSGEREYAFKKRIQLKNVSFTYPGREEKSVENINLTIDKGEIIAFVGVNGSGKSTLAKLLLGLYEPTGGIIKYDGFEKQNYSKKSFYQNKSAIFQDYYKYLFSLKDNISISQLEMDDDLEKVKQICKTANLNYETDSFPDGVDTILSKQFGGRDISGGEWQRVAIARGFYRDCDFIILDEPTSAIDPVEEANVYRKFVEISKGKTAIIITHRLGGVKIANRIVLMESGKIVEEGTHTQLMNAKGEYAELYNLQSQWYKSR